MVNLFDKLMVISSDGHMSYFGPVDRPLLREIFLGTPNSDTDKGSIADLVLEASLDKTGEMESEVKQRFDGSKVSQSLYQDIARLRSQPVKGRGVQDILPQEEYPNSWGYRFSLIAGRRMKLIGRNAVTITRMLIAILFGCVIGSLFAGSPNNLGGALAKVRILLLCFCIPLVVFCITVESPLTPCYSCHFWCKERLHLPSLLHCSDALCRRNPSFVLS